LSHATPDGNSILNDNLFFSDTFVVGQHVTSTKHNLRRGKWILGEYDPNIQPNGVVVDVRTKILHVDWIPQRHDSQLNDEPPPHIHPVYAPIVRLSNISDPTSYQIGDRVRFIDREIETGPYRAERMGRVELAGFDGNVWMVIETNTFVDVDWQDGTASKDVPAKDLRLYLNVDEYEGWPVCTRKYYV
jgi:ubiquitin-conjugating enzyme E2 O